MPNHFHHLEGFGKDDLAAYKDAREAIVVRGTLQYPDGFGETINRPFCRATINYGVFLNNILDFLIVAFAVFLLVKQVNRFLPKPPPPAPAVPTKDCGYCKTPIPAAATRCPHCTSQLEQPA